eukprot:1195112-Prorocentrum_minimum.AAC.4
MAYGSSDREGESQSRCAFLKVRTCFTGYCSRSILVRRMGAWTIEASGAASREFLSYLRGQLLLDVLDHAA